MIYITLTQALETYRRIMAQSGGLAGILNMGALESALAQPRMTFGGKDLYPITCRVISSRKNTATGGQTTPDALACD